MDKLKKSLKTLASSLSKVEKWTIFFLILLLFFTFYQLHIARTAQQHLTNKSLPIQFLALELATSMDEQKAELIRYLVEGDTVNKNAYQNMELTIERLVREMILIADDVEERSIVHQVDWLMDELDAEGALVISMDENVDKNYLDISEAIDDIDDLLDNEIVPYVDELGESRRRLLEEITGELETGIQEALLALAEYIMQQGAQESKLEFLEARDNIQLWQNVFIEKAVTSNERKWARMLNESMDKVILKADELMLNFDRRMEEYESYSKMEIDADHYIEQNLLSHGARLVEIDIENIKKNDTLLFVIALVTMAFMTGIVMFHNSLRRKRDEHIKEFELAYRDNQLKSIIQSQELERSRFAKDLHDSYGQLIAVLKLNLQTIERKVSDKSVDDKRMFSNSNSVLESMSDNLRRICFGLMPLTLEEHGLTEALQELAYKINATGSLKIKVNAKSKLLGLNENKMISVFRICQEWINNIIKHSDAGNVEIEISGDENSYSVLIKDDGSGFDKSKLMNGSGYGWKNIQSRARLLYGKVDIVSEEESSETSFILQVGEQGTIDLSQIHSRNDLLMLTRQLKMT